jgi:hypothetical protein
MSACTCRGPSVRPGWRPASPRGGGRGSTGYGFGWRDAIEGNPGRTELAEVAAVHDWWADEMEQLRAFDRALFGGSPQQ